MSGLIADVVSCLLTYEWKPETSVLQLLQNFQFTWEIALFG